MNQMHKDRLKEARRKRRKYLVKLAGINLTGIASALGAALFGLLTLVFLVFICIGIAVGHWEEIFSSGVAALVCGALTCVCGFLNRDSAEDRREAAYIPPVREQLAALPADEVLLRGSDQPTATPDELLRAAQAGKETEAQELLRAEPAQTYEQSPDTVQVQQTRG